ncbi:MAG TPA: efflux RND transporter periplasmic adaptor subunit [Aliidongia sp.]|nr:efflux RND transporter periplasmic adaptor subunit [Aliidongia sp.]
MPRHRSSLSRHWLRSAYVAIPAVAALGVGAALLDHPAPAQTAPSPPAVTVATPLVRTVNEWDQYIGRFAPSKSVLVRARVSGAVTAIHFTDGQMVKEGDPLFTIDPRPFAAALEEARAGAASAASALALAKSDYARAARLVGDNAVSASEVDSLRARAQAAEAGLAAAQARVRARTLDLEFTEVRAPIAGRVSDRRADVGNLVVGGDGTAATLLTTINALDPIYFSFDASEALYLKSRRDRTGPGAPVEVRLQDEAGYRWKGRLDFTDNGIDPRSGTIRGRATIANPDLFLTPGLFGSMRLASGAVAQALLIPSTAVQTDQARKIVLTVGADDMVTAKPVELGPEIDGLRIVTAGLADDDRVVIAGLMSAAPGAKVRPQPGTIGPVQNPISTASVPGSPVSAQASFAAD